MSSSLRRAGLAVLAAGAALLWLNPVSRADDGAAIFKQNCVVCHGADGSGKTTAGKALQTRDLGSAEVQKQTDAELTAIITDGKGHMPAFKGRLTDAQIKSLVDYIRTLKK